MNEQKNKRGNFLIGFFLGGLLGAFIIFILGTKEGKKILKQLSEKAEILEEELEEKVEKLKEKGEELLEEGERVKEKVVEEVKKRKKSASQVVISKMDKALSKIEGAQKKGIEITKNVHGRHFKKNGKKLAK